MTLALVLFTACFLVFAGLVLCLLVSADRQRRLHRARLLRVRSQVIVLPVKMQRRASAEKSDKHSVITFVERQLSQTSLRVTVTELFVQLALAVLAIYALAVLFANMSPFLAIPVAVALPAVIATLVLRRAKARYRAAFSEQMPEALDVFARGLRAGRPVADSLSIVVNTAKGAVQREFARSHNEICMGATLSESLNRLKVRIPTPEVSFFAVATSLQAETGGNLIETMESLASQLRERRKLRKKARALTSEARASAMILASLPFAVTLAIGLLNGGYLTPLYADSRGQIMSLAALCSIGLGVFVMARMGKLDV